MGAQVTTSQPTNTFHIGRLSGQLSSEGNAVRPSRPSRAHALAIWPNSDSIAARYAAD